MKEAYNKAFDLKKLAILQGGLTLTKRIQLHAKKYPTELGEFKN